MNQSILVASLAAAGIAAGSLVAPADAQYYKGKTINFLVPVPGGSGLDLQARIMAKHLAKHIPGNPKIVARNMPGGGGTKSLNFLYEKGRPDGLSINMGPWNAAGVIAGNPGIRFVPEKLEFIGASSQPATTIMRTNTNPPMKRSADIVKVKKFKVAGRSADRALDLTGNLALDIMGLKDKYIYIPGFRGMAKINPAIQRGEVHAGHSGYTGYQKFFRNTLIKEGKALALWYHSDFDKQGNPINNSSVTEFKSFHDVYKEAYGKLPSGPKWKAYRWFRTVVAQMTLSIFTAPGSPKEAVNALRKGYDGVTSSEEYQKDIVKLTGIRMTFTSRDTALKVLQTYRSVSPELKAVFKEMTAKGGPIKRGKRKKSKKRG